MKLKDKFNLSHVAGFFVGVVVTVIFNWIVFKDPKRVTAPGVAALVAMCTFTLALWSAFKVNKWVNSKVNETAFKRVDEYLLSMCKLNNKFFILMFFIKQLKKSKTNKEYMYAKSELTTRLNDVLLHSEETFSQLHLFKNWGVSFHQSKAMDVALYRAGITIGQTRSLINSISNHDTLQTANLDDYDFESMLSFLYSAHYIVNCIINIHFDKKFDFTSPSKKVD